tara:strand:+ start:30 stop:998 length:969 start_codon:yes stop_codon:yes gene_type:complete
MKMKRFVVVILLMVALVPASTAQIPEAEPPGWEIGWEGEDDIVIFELDPDTYAFELILEFWIENTYLIPIEVDFEMSLSTMELNGVVMNETPGKVSIPANSNESFELKISCQTSCLLWSADNSYLDTVEFTATNYVADQEQSSQEISQKIQPSSIYGFEVTFEPITNSKGPKINAGTYEMIDVIIWLSGNTRDAISKIDMSFRGCPQMNFDAKDSGLEAGTVIKSTISGSMKKGPVKLSAPSSHPDKTCKFIVAVTSEGNGISYTGEVEFVVEAPDVKVDDEDEDESATESSDFEVEDSSLPAISSLLCILTVLLSAVIRRN